jgi:hypothetical protein
MSVVAASACAPDDQTPVGAQPSTRPSVYVVPPPASDAPEPIDDRGVLAAYQRTPDGVSLPDPSVTPGSAFSDVGQAEICDLHYTMGIRQPRFNDKVAAFAAYGVSIHDRDIFQVDHLIPISLGGDNGEGNLWPQAYDDVAGATQKDQVERQLRGLVCSNALTLPEAQTAIATNWWAAYQTYMGRPILPGSDGPAPYTPYEPVPGEVANGASCNEEGAVGYTEGKGIALTCTATGFGQLVWQKRY